VARGTSSFKQVDVTRALRAARAAGVEIDRVEIDSATGKIVIISKNDRGDERASDLDKWMASHAR
jgi:hypothetical protein